MPIFRKIIFISWVVFLLIIGVIFFFHPNIFLQESIGKFLEQFGIYATYIYVLLFFLRSVLMIPSTVLIFVGLAFLSPLEVFLIALGGIAISSTLIFYFAEFLGLDILFRKKFPKNRIQKIESYIRKYDFWIVFGWSFFIVFPTDLVCYLAGTVHMKYKTFILAVISGEAILIGVYIFLWGML